jgi:hypothetical protein
MVMATGIWQALRRGVIDRFGSITYPVVRKHGLCFVSNPVIQPPNIHQRATGYFPVVKKHSSTT